MPAYPEDPPFEWPLSTHKQLAVRAGYTGSSGSINRVLNGLREGSSSGNAHPGLLERGLVETIPVDIEGVIETNYRITPAGIREYESYVAANGEELPPVKDAAICTNDRYLTPAEVVGGEEGGAR
jgi:hypothetical protein